MAKLPEVVRDPESDTFAWLTGITSSFLNESTSTQHHAFVRQSQRDYEFL
jgi:hypothetical protein